MVGLKDKNGKIVNLHENEYEYDDIPVDFDVDIEDNEGDFASFLIQSGQVFELNLHEENGWRHIDGVDCTGKTQEECKRTILEKLMDEDEE